MHNYEGVEGYTLDTIRRKHMYFLQEAQMHKADFYVEYIA